MVTKEPMFSAADAAGAAPLKPGLWRLKVKDEPCDFSESTPLKTWPECAGGVVIGAAKVGYYDRKGDGPPAWKTQVLVVAAGDPRIAEAPLEVSGDVKMSSTPWVYAGLAPTATDPQGRITAVGFWPVQCGPPDKDGTTTAPLPGLEMKKGDPVCATASKEALRRAAKASQAWVPKPLEAHWLRAADPDTPAL